MLSIRNLLKIRNFTKIQYGVRRFSNNSFNLKEKAEELNFISKGEKDILKKLVAKVKQSNVEHENNEIKDLKIILQKHKIPISDEVIKGIRLWKDIHH